MQKKERKHILHTCYILSKNQNYPSLKRSFNRRFKILKGKERKERATRKRKSIENHHYLFTLFILNILTRSTPNKIFNLESHKIYRLSEGSCKLCNLM